jgi:dTDP-4-amino-4,6-dideoxygalactose transaminase
MSNRIPFVDLKSQYLSIKNEVDSAIASVIGETSFIGGKHVTEFEERFGAMLGTANVISCGNGTDSLYIIMKMLGIGPGDEVITVANSWISSSETITQAGARPVFIDVHPEYYSMDERLLEEKISRKTKAIIAVHLHGQPCNIAAIKSICDAKNIFLIEDCAQSHFSEFKGKKVGHFGVAASFSFYPGKNLGAYGDAGCMITDDTTLATKLRMYARHGALKKHNHVIEGINSRMDGLQAAILNVKLKHILSWTSKRIEHAAQYDKCLRNVSHVVTPRVRPDSVHTYHLYVIRAKKRDALAKWLSDNQIETGIHYPGALPNLEAYRYLGHSPADFPVATALQDEILSLPMYPELTSEKIDYIGDKIEEFYKREERAA